MQIKTIAELNKVKKEDPEGLKEFVKQHVTIKDDLARYQVWLHDNEIETKFMTTISRTHQRSLGLHPSSACKADVCMLKLYHEMTGEIPQSRPYEQALHRIFDLGHQQHRIHQIFFQEMYGGLFEDEMYIGHKPHLISSHADGHFDFSKLTAILEIKTIKDSGAFGWEKVQTAPLQDNVRQLHFYMKYSDTPFGILFYAAKNTGKYKEWPIVFDQDLWDEMESGVVLPSVASAKAKIPPKGSPGFMKCKQCGIKQTCPERDKELKRANKPKVFGLARRR